MKSDLGIILILFMVFSSCQTEIDIKTIIKENSPLVLTLKTNEVDFVKNMLNQTDTIKINSEKWNKLEEFASNNMNGWKTSPASYISDFYLSQEEFRLLGWTGGNAVVIGFVDLNGKSLQYSKKIKPGELDFLLK